MWYCETRHERCHGLANNGHSGKVNLHSRSCYRLFGLTKCIRDTHFGAYRMEMEPETLRKPSSHLVSGLIIAFFLTSGLETKILLSRPPDYKSAIGIYYSASLIRKRLPYVHQSHFLFLNHTVTVKQVLAQIYLLELSNVFSKHTYF